MSDPDFTQPYADPLWDRLDELEASIELSMGPEPLLPGPIMGADPMGQMLGAVEASIEGSVVPPPLLPEPSLPPLQEEQLNIVPSSPSEGPPLLADPAERYWISIEPPLAAKPYFTTDGLRQASYHPRHGSGSGIRHSGNSDEPITRLCPVVNDYVSPEACESCEHWVEEAVTGLGWCGYTPHDEEHRDSDEGSEE